MQVSIPLNEARLQGVINFLAAGSGQAKVQIFDGTKPAFGAAAGVTPLVEVLLVEPVGVVSAGVLSITPTDEYMITRTGGATWARVINGDGVHGFDCDVTGLAGAGPLRLSETTLYAGGYARIVSGEFT